MARNGGTGTLGGVIRNIIFDWSGTLVDDLPAVSTATGFGKYIERQYVSVIDKRKVIHRILAENKLLPEETLFVGDMQHDIETARHGGVASCAVLTGYNSLQQLRASEPDVIVEHL